MLKQLLSSAVTLLAATSLCAQNLPETNGDPTNDTIGGAEIGALGAQHYGYMAVGDSDFWAVTIGAGSVPLQLTAWTSGRGTSNPADDTILTLYDAGGLALASNDDFAAGNTLLSTISYGISAPGTYYLEVESWLGVTDGDYALDVVAAPIAVQNCPGIAPIPPGSESEPNNTCSNAGVIAPCTSRTENLQTAGDSDFYCFVLGASTTVDFETVLDSAIANQRPDTKLWLYNSACTEIDNDDDGGAGLLSRLATTLTAGTYYIGVSDWQRSAPGGYRLVFNTQTVLIPSGTGTAGDTTVVDLKPKSSICAGTFPATGVDNEPNSTPAEAQSSGNFIVPCTDTIGTIGMVASGVTDMWCFTVASTSDIIFEVVLDSVLPGAYTDTKLWLYDSQGLEIDNDDDGGAGLLSRLERTYAPGNYYIECHDWQRAQTGTFRLRMDQLSSPPKCLGGLGTSVKLVARENELVQQNSNVTVDISGAAAPGVMFLSFGGAVIPPLGLDLTIIGMPNCSLYVNPPVANPAYIPGNGADYEYSYPVGGLPAGSQINVQAALIDGGAAIYRPLFVTLSDTTVSWTVGDQTFH
ncbi:MAG: PPC domain-containing protein [Planctomycetes bacterium]|nr:PPC domain-containing protein [Planctomycetota bacterium]